MFTICVPQIINIYKRKTSDPILQATGNFYKPSFTKALDGNFHVTIAIADSKKSSDWSLADFSYGAIS